MVGTSQPMHKVSIGNAGVLHKDGVKNAQARMATYEPTKLPKSNPARSINPRDYAVVQNCIAQANVNPIPAMPNLMTGKLDPYSARHWPSRISVTVLI